MSKSLEYVNSKAPIDVQKEHGLALAEQILMCTTDHKLFINPPARRFSLAFIAINLGQLAIIVQLKIDVLASDWIGYIFVWIHFGIIPDVKIDLLETHDDA